MPKLSFRGVAVVLFLVVVVLVLWLSGRQNTTPDDNDADRPRRLVVETPTKTPTQPLQTLTIPDPTVDVARSAVVAWQQQDVNVRSAQLQPLTTPDYFALIADADPANVPAAPIDTVEGVGAEDGEAAVNVILTDGTELTVALVDPEVDGSWLVSNIQLAGS